LLRKSLKIDLVANFFAIFFWRCAVTLVKKIACVYIYLLINWNNWNRTNTTEMAGPICCYDFTLSAGEAGDARNAIQYELTTFLKDHCKAYAYQLEKGETGYVHFQGRVSLGTKRRLVELIALVHETFPKLLGCHWSPTFTDNKLPAKAFYCMKPETRLEGPWTSEDLETLYVPRQLREVINFYPWQTKVIASAEEWDARSINVVLETIGCRGKSILATHMGVHRLACSLPPLNDYKDLMRMVMDMPTSRCYLVDMPRAINQNKLNLFYAALEEVKSGHAWDDRYTFKQKYFDAPNIWVFCNTMPDVSTLSKDRWKFWRINVENDLEAFIPNF